MRSSIVLSTLGLVLFIGMSSAWNNDINRELFLELCFELDLLEDPTATNVYGLSDRKAAKIQEDAKIQWTAKIPKKDEVEEIMTAILQLDIIGNINQIGNMEGLGNKKERRACLNNKDKRTWLKNLALAFEKESPGTVEDYFDNVQKVFHTAISEKKDEKELEAVRKEYHYIRALEDHIRPKELVA